MTMVRYRNQGALGYAPDGLGASDLVSTIKSVGRAVTTDQIRGVVFRSQISPDVPVDPVRAMSGEPRPVSEGGLSELFLRIAKPAFYLDTTYGSVRLAPWGEPAINLYPVFLIGTLVGGALLAGAVARGLRG